MGCLVSNAMGVRLKRPPTRSMPETQIEFIFATDPKTFDYLSAEHS